MSGTNRSPSNKHAANHFLPVLRSFITILKIKPHSHPSIYVAVLAVSDNFCLVTKILFTELTRHDINVGPYGCKFLYFIGNTMAIYANWLLVMMTVSARQDPALCVPLCVCVYVCVCVCLCVSVCGLTRPFAPRSKWSFLHTLKTCSCL